MAAREEIKRKVNEYVRDEFNGNWRAAFDHYADARDRVTVLAVQKLLADAGVRFLLTSWPVAKAVVEELDADADGFVQWAEFERRMRA